MEYKYQIQKDSRDLRVFRSCLAGRLAELSLVLWRSELDKTKIKNKDRQKLEDEIHKVKTLYEDVCLAVFALENHHLDSHLIFEENEMKVEEEQEKTESRFDNWLNEQNKNLPDNYARLIASAFKQFRLINKNLEKLTRKKGGNYIAT